MKPAEFGEILLEPEKQDHVGGIRGGVGTKHEREKVGKTSGQQRYEEDLEPWLDMRMSERKDMAISTSLVLKAYSSIFLCI